VCPCIWSPACAPPAIACRRKRGGEAAAHYKSIPPVSFLNLPPALSLPPQAATVGFLSLMPAFNHCAELKLLTCSSTKPPAPLDYEDDPLLVLLQLYCRLAK